MAIIAVFFLLVKAYKYSYPSTVNFKLTASSRKVTVKWNKVTGASGYKIYYKTSKNGSWKSLKTVNNRTTSYTKTGLAKGKTYYFTVRAYRTTGGKTYNGGYATKSVKSNRYKKARHFDVTGFFTSY